MRRRRAQFKSEAELAAQTVEWLEAQGWTVYKEVPFLARTIDIVATQQNIVWVIECKLQFGSAVLEQAYDMLRFAHYVSVAVPQGNHSKVFEHFVRHYGIGKLHIHNSSMTPVSEDSKPTLYRKSYVNKLRGALREEYKSNQAGVQSGNSMTPYKITIEQIKNFLRVNGPQPMKKIVESVKHHYASSSTARSVLPRRIMELHKEEFVITNEGRKFIFDVKR